MHLTESMRAKYFERKLETINCSSQKEKKKTLVICKWHCNRSVPNMFLYSRPELIIQPHAKHNCNRLGFVDLELILVHYLDSKLQLGCLECMKKRPGCQKYVEWKFRIPVFV